MLARLAGVILAPGGGLVILLHRAALQAREGFFQGRLAFFEQGRFDQFFGDDVGRRHGIALDAHRLRRQLAAIDDQNNPVSAVGNDAATLSATLCTLAAASSAAESAASPAGSTASCARLLC